MTDQPDFLVHHEGPDDIHPCKTWLSAVNLANTLNAEYERWALARTQEFGKIRVRSWAAPYTLEDAKDAGVISKETP